MEIKYLHTFRTIVTEGSFTKAADKLNYTQSTITFQMKLLEQELSIKLFEKIGRNMILTKAGEELVPYVDEVMNSMERLSGFSENLLDLKGELHIESGETILCYKMAPVLKEFHRLAPQAKLYLRSTNCYEILEKVKTGKIDLGIFYLNVCDTQEFLETYPIGECTMDLVASPRTKEKYNDFMTPNQNMDLAFIIDEPDCIFRQIFEDYLKSKNIKLDHEIELWSIPTIKNLVMNDVGITFLPTFTVENELRSGELCKIKTELDKQKLVAVCAHHKNKWVSPLMKLFIQIVTSSNLFTQ
jgi:Transcriptional regulator